MYSATAWRKTPVLLNMLSESYDIKGRKMSHLLSLQISRLNLVPTHVESFRQLPPFFGNDFSSPTFLPPKENGPFPPQLVGADLCGSEQFLLQGLYWYKHWRAGKLNWYQLGSWWDRRDRMEKFYPVIARGSKDWGSYREPRLRSQNHRVAFV